MLRIDLVFISRKKQQHQHLFYYHVYNKSDKFIHVSDIFIHIIYIKYIKYIEDKYIYYF
jgi:hypothetical protein